MIGITPQHHQIGKQREGNGTEAAEAGERLALVVGRLPLLGFDLLQDADCRDDVARFGFRTAGNGRYRRGCRACFGGGNLRLLPEKR